MSRDIASISGHIVILGWSARVERIISELRNDVHQHSDDLRPILVVTPETISESQTAFDRVYFISGRVSDMQVLRRANLHSAHSVLIPSPLPEPEAADGQSVFSLLATLSINPAIRVCVEVSSATSCDTLAFIQRNGVTQGDVEVISFDSVASRLLAQAAVNRGITRVYNHLLSFGDNSNEIYVSDLNPKWIGKTYRELAMECFNNEVTTIGFERGADLQINPRNRDLMLQLNDRLWFIAFNRAAGLKIIG